MSSPPSPPRPERRISAGTTLFITLGIIVAACAVGAVGASVFGGRTTPDETPEANGPEPAVVSSMGLQAQPDEAQIRRWFTDRGSSGASQYGHVKKVAWAGQTLVFDTDLRAGTAAQQPAMWICDAGVDYLTEQGERYPAVQINDATGQTLASRRAVLDDRCVWRPQLP